MMAGSSFQGLLVALLIGCVAAIVCPPELVQGAPVGLSEGAKCGGTCNTHGSCAAGLRCKETPTTPFLGVRPAGVCSSAGGHVALDSKDIQTVVKEAVQLLNGQLSLCLHLNFRLPTAAFKAAASSLWSKEQHLHACPGCYSGG